MTPKTDKVERDSEKTRSESESAKSDEKSSSKGEEKESRYLDPWSQAIATFGMPKIPKKKAKVTKLFLNINATVQLVLNRL